MTVSSDRGLLVEEILEYVRHVVAKAPTASDQYHVLKSVASNVEEMAYSLTRGSEVICR